MTLYDIKEKTDNVVLGLNVFNWSGRSFAFVQLQKRWSGVSSTIWQKEQRGESSFSFKFCLDIKRCLKFYIEILKVLSLFLSEKCIPKIVVVFLVKSIHSIRQSTRNTPFRSPMPAISHFALLGYKPERSKNLWKTFIIPFTEPLSLSKNVKLSA